MDQEPVDWSTSEPERPDQWFRGPGGTVSLVSNYKANFLNGSENHTDIALSRLVLDTSTLSDSALDSSSTTSKLTNRY